MTVIQANFASGVDELRAADDVHQPLDRLGEGPRRRPRYAGIDFPTHCEIPVADLTVAIEEFLATGQRPTLVPWQQVR
ncbi:MULTISPECIES: Imm1 family immunity protein [Saccharothrix]|uniref:Imm1 family immunity protein n=1 Tax=Saccharothrix TaxID=2071 RepID=UPI000967988A|nr:Imm1 family immunity protein [Saccharothrix sp. CB00851]OKI37614.1 hypothetical protein A6A25_18790 [Saccharothrix sp. CB00851]